MNLKYFSVCRVRCCSCKSILEYQNRSKTDSGPGRMMVCSCGSVALDPAATMYRIVGLKRDNEWEDLSIPWDESEEKTPNAETLAALEEVERMRQDPSIGKGYRNLDELFADLKK